MPKIDKFGNLHGHGGRFMSKDSGSEGALADEVEAVRTQNTKDIYESLTNFEFEREDDAFVFLEANADVLANINQSNFSTGTLQAGDVAAFAKKNGDAQFSGEVISDSVLVIREISVPLANFSNRTKNLENIATQEQKIKESNGADKIAQKNYSLACKSLFGFNINEKRISDNFAEAAIETDESGVRRVYLF